MTTRSSGEHAIDRAEVRRLREELDELIPQLRAKALRVAAVSPVSPAHREFLIAYRSLIVSGWGVREIARALDVSHRYIIDLRAGNRPPRTEARDWIAAAWTLVQSREVPLPSNGTWG